MSLWVDFSSLFPEDKSKQNIKITKSKKIHNGLLMVIAIGILVMSFSDFGFNTQDKRYILLIVPQ